MEGNSRGKHSLDLEQSSTLAKKHKSKGNNPKAPGDIEAPNLQIETQESINNLDNCLNKILKPEIEDLTVSWESLETQYQNLDSCLGTEKIPKEIVRQYNTRMKKKNSYTTIHAKYLDKFQELIGSPTPLESESDTRNRTTKTQKPRDQSKKVLSLIEQSKKLVDQIKKEKDRSRKTKDEVTKRIEGKQCKIKVKRQTIQGDEFQRILQVLIRKRALSSPGAEVGIEVSGVGQLDDAVFLKKTENKCRFFQIKHTTRKVPCVTAKELFKCEFKDNGGDENLDVLEVNTNHVEGRKRNKESLGLHLLMYLKSFCNIRESSKFEKCSIEEVTLITNRDIQLFNRKKGHELDLLLVNKFKSGSEIDECLDLKGRRAEKYGLKVKETKERFFEILLKESHKHLSTRRNDAAIIIDEFLEKIHVVVNYPDLQHLREMVFKEVFDEDVFRSLNQTVLENFMLHTEIKLLQGKNEFTSNEEWESEINEIKKFIYGYKSVAVTDLKTQSLQSHMDFNVTFENLNDMDKDIKQLIEGNRQVLECRGKNFKMNSIKIIHILQNKRRDISKFKFIFCEYDNFLSADFLQQAFLNGNVNLLVLICKNITDNENVLWTSLENALKDSKKMIIVSRGKSTFASSLEHTLKNKLLRKEYQHGYKCLTQDCKETLCNKQILFQKKEITFGELISPALANNIVDDNCLYNFAVKRNLKINISDDSSFCSLGYNEEYYISREFYQKKISFNTLKNNMLTKVFFVTGINKTTEDEINTFFKTTITNEELVQKWESEKEYENGIVLGYHQTKSDGQIYNTMSSATKHVYWVSMNESKELFLVDCRDVQYADINLVDKTEPSPEKDLNTNVLGRIVILVGDSGVGKSTTLTSLANKIRQACSKTWVARVILSKAYLLRTLENTTKLGCPDNAIACVCNMIFTRQPQNILDTNLIKEGLKCSYRGIFRFVLLIDGFNEINENLQEKLITLIKTLRDHCNVDQIWITTQNHNRVKLETELEVTSYFLKPLNDDDQINLMARYWQTEYTKKNPAVKHNYEQLYLQAKDDIHKFKSFLNSKEKRLFTQNSLNLTMLANVLMNNDYKINEKLNIFNLYEIFVQHKFSVYMRETSLDQGYNLSTRDKLFENYVRGILQEFSVKTVFNNQKTYQGDTSTNKLPGMDVYEQFKSFVGTTSECELTLSKLGLMNLKNHDFDFIHPSFAQFFFCEYLIKNIFKCDRSLKEIWVQLVLSTSSFQLCRRFLNQALSRLQESSPTELMNMKNNLASTYTKKLIQKTRNSAAPIKENLYYLTLFLLRWLKENDFEIYLNKIFNQDFKSSCIMSNIPKIITHFQTIPKEQAVKLLILLYQNMNDEEKLLSFVQEETNKSEEDSEREFEENSDQELEERSDQELEYNYDSDS